DGRLRELERRAAPPPSLVQNALEAAGRAALHGPSRLTSLLTPPGGDAPPHPQELRPPLSIPPAGPLMGSNLDGAAIYQFGHQRSHLELVTAHLRTAAPTRVDRPDPTTRWDAAIAKIVGAATAESDLHPVATYALGQADDPHGYLVLMSRDQLATVRRAPSTDEMLKAGAQLIGGALASQRLIADLENSNRLLSALGDMTAAMLKPGASRHQVIDAVVGHLTDAQVSEFDFNFATVYLLDERDDGASLVRMAAGAATAATIESGPVQHAAGKRVPRWAQEEDRVLADDDVLVYVARSWQPVLVGPLPSTEHADVISGAIPVTATWAEVPVVYSNGMVKGSVLACLIGERALADGQAPFTLAGEVFERGGHKDLIRVFVPFGSDQSQRATGVLEVGYHRSDQRRPDWGQVEALRAAAAQVAVAVETARLYEDARRHAEQLELGADVSKAIASSIDLEQTLRLVAHTMVRLVDASTCQIALYEEDGEGWYGAAASDQEELWQRQRGDRPQPPFLFEVLDRGEPLVVEDAIASDLVGSEYARDFG